MILIAYGTRPEYIKLKPLLWYLKEYEFKVRVLYVAQHKDIIESPEYDSRLMIKNKQNRLDSILCSILNNEKIFNGVSQVLVQGDTTTAFAMALAAFHRKIPVIHLEAGLRTNKQYCPYPEEFNRVAIDRIASLFLCATDNNRNNLIVEGVIPSTIFVTGNTGLDNLINIKPTYEKLVFCTMHRRENHPKLKEWFSTISILADIYHDYTFILPLHPNPNVVKNKVYLSWRIVVCEPLKHDTAIDYLSRSAFVITDSGGIQEEASFLNKRAFICREYTERTECLNKTSILCKTPPELFRMFMTNDNNYELKGECPYGDGHASERIAKILVRIYD